MDLRSLLSLRGSRRRHRQVFSRIFHQNLWGNPESVSGPGSTQERGKSFAGDVIGLVQKLGVRTLLDAPCGDFNWAAELAAAVDTYVGVDVVEELIARNTERHAGANRQFLTCDLTRDPLPRADLILSRDCLVHFSFRDIRAAVENFRRSGAEYLLTTTFVDRATNDDIRTGGWRVLNLQAPPFHFGEPLALIDERCTHTGGIYRDKRLGLWPMKSFST